MGGLRRPAAVGLLVAALGGCENAVTYSQLNEVWHDSGAARAPLPSSTWYYRGSDDRYHYFAFAEAFSDTYRSYVVKKTEIVVRGSFPLASARSKWKRIDLRLASFKTPADVHFPRTLNFTER
jgi:hypothetical protein